MIFSGAFCMHSCEQGGTQALLIPSPDDLLLAEPLARAPVSSS